MGVGIDRIATFARQRRKLVPVLRNKRVKHGGPTFLGLPRERFQLQIGHRRGSRAFGDSMVTGLSPAVSF